MNEYEILELSFWLDDQAQDLEDRHISETQLISRLRRKAQALRETQAERKPKDTANWARGAMAALVAVVVLVAMACTITGGASGPDATATYGAGQFHAQLTAQAVQATRAELP